MLARVEESLAPGMALQTARAPESSREGREDLEEEGVGRLTSQGGERSAGMRAGATPAAGFGLFFLWRIYSPSAVILSLFL